MKACNRKLGTTSCTLIAAALLAGCAGDLGAVKDSAKDAATFVGSLQKSMFDAIDQQKTYRQIELTQSKELQLAGQMNLASVDQYRATWSAANLKDPNEIFKSMAESVPDADLSKGAPFVLMAPLPEFAAPAIDRKTFTDLIEKFNKLSQGPSPIDRAKALIPFVKVVVKAYGDSVKGAKAEPALASGGGTALTAAASPQGANSQTEGIESQTTNTAPVASLLSTLGQ